MKALLLLVGIALAEEPASPLCGALLSEKVEITRLERTLEGGADPNLPCEVPRVVTRRLSFLEVLIGMVIPPVGALMLISPGTETRIYHPLPLSLALGRGSTAAVERLLAQGADPLLRDPEGNSPLQVAITADLRTDEARWTHLLLGERRIPADLLCSQTHLLDELVEKPMLRRRLESAGLPPGGLDCEGQSVLHRAARRGDEDRVLRILDEGLVPLEARDPRGRTALCLAYQGADAEVVELLLQRGSGVLGACGEQGSLLHLAADKGDLVFARKLLDLGHPITGRAESGETLISIAVRRGDEQLLGLLLEQGADIKAESDPARLLHDAVVSGRAAILERLLAAGLDPQLPWSFGQRPLDLAWERRDLPVAAVLVRHGARVQPPDISSVFKPEHTPLEAALIAGDPKWLDLFLPAASDADREDALLSLVIYGRWEAADRLLQLGTQPGPALVFFAGLGDEEQVAALRQRGARFPPDAIGRLIRDEAPPEMLRLALADGADPEAPLPDGQRPVDRALADKNDALLQVLVEAGVPITSPVAIEDALRWEEIERVHFLVGLGAPVSKKALHLALDRDDDALLAFLLVHARLSQKERRRLWWRAFLRGHGLDTLRLIREVD